LQYTPDTFLAAIRAIFGMSKHLKGDAVHRKALLGSLFLFLFATTPLLADDVAFTGTAAFDDPATGTSMSPYSGTLNGQSVEYFCVDFSTGVSSTSSWTATPTFLTNSPPHYENTLQFQMTGSNNTAENSYLEMAWLIEQLQAAINANDLDTAAQDEWAIWSFSGGLDPYNTNAGLLGNAQLAVQNGFTVSGWEILTPEAGQRGQEIILVTTPEAGTLVLLLFGVIAVFAMGQFRRPGLQ
jgi:hypothetical protein